MQDPTPIESTGRCVFWAHFEVKRNLYFLPPCSKNISAPLA